MKLELGKTYTFEIAPLHRAKRKQIMRAKVIGFSGFNDEGSVILSGRDERPDFGTVVISPSRILSATE